MSLTARRLNRATLGRQLLLLREPLDVAEAVRRVVALQAQEAPSPYLALWNRLAGFDPADLDAVFASRAVVKATLLRITLHAVHADDYPAFHNAMVPSLRASRLHDRRYTTTGLTIADADAILPQLLAFADRPRTKAEVEDLFEARMGERQPRMWWALRTFAPLLHAPTGGPWSFGPRSSFVAAPAQLPPERQDASTRWVVRRYLEGFGPASVQDVAHSTLLAYADRSRVIPPDYRRLVIRNNGDVLPTLLVDGHVAGVWRPVEGGIQATTFQQLPKKAWTGLAEEAEALMSFLAGRDPMIYRRYTHWWSKLPSAETRVLPG